MDSTEVEVVTANGQAHGHEHFSLRITPLFDEVSPAHLLMIAGALGMALVFRPGRNR
jgi:hypothetical protein